MRLRSSRPPGPRLGHPHSSAVHAAITQLVAVSTWPVAQRAELMNVGRAEAVGFTCAALSFLDRRTYPVIAKRRRTGIPA